MTAINLKNDEITHIQLVLPSKETVDVKYDPLRGVIDISCKYPKEVLSFLNDTPSKKAEKGEGYIRVANKIRIDVDR